ncbi:MAG: glycoside hydrolase family 15 protein [Chthoniobacteraceae bacterium]
MTEVKASEDFGLKGDLARWKQVRNQIHAEVCGRGFDSTRGTFTQYFGGKELDASLLMMPLVGFLPADDERVRSTVLTIQKELMYDGFVLRYSPADSAKVDGLPPGEGTFLPCSFWMVSCLHLIGRHDEAMEMFERLLGLRNDLGLLSEEYDPVNRRLLGNFPQAFSHVALINSANRLTGRGMPASNGHEPTAKVSGT